MFSHYVVALLLGASAVLAFTPSCNFVENAILRELRAQLDPNASPDITATNFENRVQVARSDDRQSYNTFLVKKNGQPIPTVNIDGATYQLHSCSVIPLIRRIAASLVVSFSPEKSRSPAKGVSILVPILLFKNYTPEVNENLNEDFEVLGSLPTNGRFNMSLAWLPEVLPKANIMIANTSRKLYLLGCEKIFDDVMDSFY